MDRAKLIFRFCFLISLAPLMSACSDGDGGGSGLRYSCHTLEGHYYQNSAPANTLDIAGDCTFTDSHCGYTASYTVPNSSGDTIVTVANTNGTPACMSNTAHACQLAFNGIQLGIDCDGGAHVYYFVRQ